MSGPRLYTIGNFTIDDIVLWPDGRTWMRQAGGNVLFSALGARVWLQTVGILARVGNDYPAARLEDIRARGLVPELHEVAAPTMHDWALYEESGARQFVNHLSSSNQEVMTLGADEIPDRCLDGCAYHIASMPSHQQLALVKRLKDPARLISLDPHELWITGRESTVQEAVAAVDFFLPSEIEARHLYGANAPEEAARAFTQLGPRAVVIKLGAGGSLVYDAVNHRVAHVPAYPAKACDPTGAGDSFCGGFLAGFLLTGDCVTAAQYGTVSASYTVEAVGALTTPQPLRADADARLQVVADRTACTTRS